jgi:plasmid stability protein
VSVTLSIKNAPDDLVRQLKLRAQRNHRSLQGELLAILEDVVRAPSALSPQEVHGRVARLKLHTPPEAARIIRAARDAR